jgi:1,4-dihydroxy-2-naphthoyl-CoA synthase
VLINFADVSFARSVRHAANVQVVLRRMETAHGVEDLLYETRNQAAWITLNRPRLLNALSAEMLRSIRRSYAGDG